MEKSALENPLALTSEFWQKCFVLSGRLCFLQAFCRCPSCLVTTTRVCCCFVQWWPALERRLQGSSCSPPPQQCPAGGKQLHVGQEGRGRSSKAEEVGDDIWSISYLGVKLCHPQEGFLGNGGVWLNTTVEQKMGRHKRPGNIQKPLGELPKMCASLSINHDLISPSAWSSTGSVNYAFWLSGYPTGRGFLLCSLFEGKGHAFFNSTGALSYSPCLLALLSSRPLL